MPGRLKRQPSHILIEPTPTLRQKYFPSPKQTVCAKPSPWSTRSRRQQTITQMPLLIDFYHPQQENLEYEQETEEDHRERMPRSKRRKLSNGDVPAAPKTRRAKKQAVDPQPVPGPQNEDRRIKHDVLSEAAMVNSTMPPPKTPLRQRRKEIPSSQSPAGTPLSTQSRRSERQVSRSPLKEKSNAITNIPSIADTPKRLRWALRREVADSMDSEGRLSRMSTKSSNDSLKTEPGLDQPSAHAAGKQPTDGPPTTPGSTPNVKNHPESIIQVPSSPATRTQAYASTYPGSPPINTNPVRLDYSQSESQEPSFQLQYDLHRTTQPVSGLQTDSQFEADWQPFQQSSPLPPSSPPCIVSSQIKPEVEDVSNTTYGKINSQFLPRACRVERSRHPVPPSQATTVDGTQVLEKVPSSAPPSTQPGMPSSTPIRPSTPQMQAFPFSPATTRNEATKLERHAEGRLTDSQLFPESLLNDTIPAPPVGWRMLMANGEIDEIED